MHLKFSQLSNLIFNCSNRMRKDRSCSAGLLEFSAPSGSPDPSRRNKEKTTGLPSTARLRNTPHTTLVDLTIFHIPGMDVKLQYQSKVRLLKISYISL